MDTAAAYRKIVENLIRRYASKPSNGAIEPEIVIGADGNHYELMHIGWNGSRRIHGSVLHIDLIGDKIWIQHDGTPTGVASEIAEQGVPKEDIVLAFRPGHVRPHTGYGVG
jgi:hypothetical protein